MNDSSTNVGINMTFPFKNSLAKNFLRTLVAIATSIGLIACGGGDSKVINKNPPSNTVKSSAPIASSSAAASSTAYKPGVYKSSSELRNYCAVPRRGVSKLTGKPSPDKLGTWTDEKNFLRSWSHETYLWFNELPDLDPATPLTPQDYFMRLKTNKNTSAGVPKDNFHFYEPTSDAEARDAGLSYGYGIELSVESPFPKRKYYVAYVEPGSPAAIAGVTRGALIVGIDSYDFVNDTTDAALNAFNEALWPSRIGAVHSFQMLEVGAAQPRTFSLQSAEVAVSPVLLTRTLDVGDTKVGYVVFNSHVEKAQDQWVDTINQFKQAGVTDVVLDLRYNGGGLISIASQVSYMLGGIHTENKVFFKQIQNSKQPQWDPFEFLNVGIYGTNENLSLPALDLQRVYVLSSSGTCSASEAIINGLRGVDIEVYLFGEKTCGKPYGFYPEPNCGTTYYTIQMAGANAKNFGEYSNGFSPSANPNNPTLLPGCFVSDDLTHQLGDPQEKMLATALHYRATGSCLTNSTGRLQKASGPSIGGEFIAPETHKILIMK